MRQLVLLGLLGAALAASAAAPSRSLRELRFAEQSLLVSLMQSASREVQRVCRANVPACLNRDQTELVLSLIGNRSDREATDHLAALIRYRLDAGGGESYDCEVLEHGRAVDAYWRRTAVETLRNQCLDDVAKSRAASGLEDVSAEQVCASPEEIRSRQKSLRQAIRRSARCNAEDF